MTVTPDLQPPGWMKRGPKREFRRVVAARKALNRPVTTAELDTLVDYVETRDRIADLQEKMSAVRIDHHFLQFCRAINSAVAISRALARDLGLTDAPRSSAGDQLPPEKVQS